MNRLEEVGVIHPKLAEAEQPIRLALERLAEPPRELRGALSFALDTLKETIIMRELPLCP